MDTPQVKAIKVIRLLRAGLSDLSVAPAKELDLISNYDGGIDLLIQDSPRNQRKSLLTSEEVENDTYKTVFSSRLLKLLSGEL